MGAGGSTAASCSSLEVGELHRPARSHNNNNNNNNNNHHHHGKPLQLQISSQQQLLQRAHKYGNKKVELANGRHKNKSANMKHYSSHFDLTNEQLLLNHGDRRDQLARCAQPDSKLVAPAGQGWFEAGQSDTVYSLSSANIGLVRPLVLATGAPEHQQHQQQRHYQNHHHHHYRSPKKVTGNGPSATRVQQRQAQRSSDLKRFSDSLPSLNSLAVQVGPTSPEMQPVRRPACDGPHRQHLRLHAVEASRPSHQCPHAAMKRATSLSSLQQSPAPSYELPPDVESRQQRHQHHQHHHLHQHQHSQITSVAKKIFRFRQQAAPNQPLAGASKKYKRKQAPVAPVVAAQQGCQVLPPLPRSQSLHELIQLRATENGQRMRTTGTLRTSAVQAGENSSRVNLVAEILESRRNQQRTDHDEQEPNHIQSASFSSRLSGSSIDDGIHDVSLSGDQSTADSRQQKNYRKGCSPNSAKQELPNQRTEEPRSQGPEPIRKSFEYPGLGKSTLKRSQSHSVLHQNLSSAHDGLDEEESEDLSELAKFLYQFKRRQEAQAISNRIHQQAEVSTRPIKDEQPKARPGSAAEILPASASPGKQQQSPSSTSSSSGFASSSCATNSISSAGSTNPEKSRRLLGNSRKKYPAPAKPDAGLKSAPSLLSIVDESRVNGKLEERASPMVSHQLEQLERYTQLRQMSQSELALNHLTSGDTKLGSKERDVQAERGQHRNSSSKPYASKLINLIRRRGDKPITEPSQTNGASLGGGKTRNGSVGGPRHCEDTLLVADRSSPINQAGSIVPSAGRSNCRPADLDLDLDLDRRQAGGSSGRVPASESVCDLNFDCDLELIKSCATNMLASPSRLYRAPTNEGAAPRHGSSLLSLSNQRALISAAGAKERDLRLSSSKGCGSPTCMAGGSPSLSNSASACPGKRQQAIKSTGKCENNNWQLLASAKQGANCAVVGQKRRATGDCQSMADDRPAGKLKWSASNWLINGSDSNPSKGKDKQASGKTSYLARLIPSSRASAASVCKQEDPRARSSRAEASREEARLSCEADQLLDELDQSLDLVSSRSAFSRKVALGGVWRSRAQLGSLSTSENSDEEELEEPEYQSEQSADEDYASISRALIEATFDADLLAEHRRQRPPLDSASPSDSFTFSAPSSPGAKLEGERKLAVKDLCAKHEHEIARSATVADEQAGHRFEPDAKRLISNALEQVANLVGKTTNNELDGSGPLSKCHSAEIGTGQQDSICVLNGAKLATESGQCSNRCCGQRAANRESAFADHESCPDGRKLIIASKAGAQLGSPLLLHDKVGLPQDSQDRERARRNCNCNCNCNCNGAPNGQLNELARPKRQASADIDPSKPSRRQANLGRAPVCESAKCKATPVKAHSQHQQLHRHHGRATNYNEDVKLAGVSRDNPIWKTGRLCVEDATKRSDKGAPSEPLQLSTCCLHSCASAAPQSESPGFGAAEKPLPEPGHKHRHYMYNRLAPEPTTHANPSPAKSNLLLSGAPKLISIKSKLAAGICRSNSELVSARSDADGQFMRATSKLAGVKAMPMDRLRGSAKFDGQQACLNRSLLQSAGSSSHLLLASKGPPSYVGATNFDDNFILRRKTPNAGLKSRC